MVIITAIGRFFKKIWDWIRQTAWIQPLLIVGIIFGVIFSIPSIVKAVNAKKEEKAKYQAYYHNFQISLELEKGDDPKSSPADQFTYALENVMFGTEGAEEEFKNKYSNLGDKFFVAYVGQDCDKCRDAKDGFALFQELLNKDESFKTGKNEDFHMVSIFTDEETSYTTDDETAFVKYLERHETFFEEVGSLAYSTDYYAKGNLNDADLEALETADPVDFLTPTIFLVEIGEQVHYQEFGPGVSEVMFGVKGDDQNDKAKTLFDCWTHKGDFSIND